MVGCRQATIARWERGVRQVSIEGLALAQDVGPVVAALPSDQNAGAPAREATPGPGAGGLMTAGEIAARLGGKPYGSIASRAQAGSRPSSWVATAATGRARTRRR